MQKVIKFSNKFISLDFKIDQRQNEIMRWKFCFIIFISQVASAQEVQQEINDQVWKPFIKNFNERNTDGFMAVHSKDVVRSPRDAKLVWNWDEYYKNQKEGDDRGKTSSSKRQLELRFTERINNSSSAVDVGVYKTSVIRPDGTSRSSYGRFHVVLRKEKGTWKILADTDSSEGETITEKEFLAASPME
jgi:ketosteroid isomerase-like protein